MTPDDRAAGALGPLFDALEETAAWQRDLAEEARTARTRRDRLVAAIRAVIETLPPAMRKDRATRLTATTGIEPPRPRRPRPTARTTRVLTWLASRDETEFHTSDLRAHFETEGERTPRTYLPTILRRYAQAGILTRIGHGRYRVNRDHPELVEIAGISLSDLRPGR